MPDLLRTLLAPVLLVQGKRMFARMPRLDAPADLAPGPRGDGSPIHLLVVGDSSAAGYGADRQEDVLLGQLVARLAHGRMGDVYKAKVHGVEGFERILVVKTIHPGYAAVPGFLDVVVEEAQRAVLLSHANVAQVLNLGQEEEQQRAFLATEYVNGLDLERAMQIARGAQTAWPMEISVFIAAEIANGLDYAHRRKDYNFNLLNIMHRDLSPTNVMLSNDGDVKVSDFGISRAMTLIPPNDDQERLRRVLYQAPESVRTREQEYTQQSDIFSLGLLLYEMLAGIHPYLTTTRDAEALSIRF